MGYHTHFYAYDENKQADLAKEILARYKQQLQKELDNIPNDDFFKNMYQQTLKMVSDEKYQEFRENAKKYDWPKWCIDDNECFFMKYRDPKYTWEDEKKEWVGRLIDLKNTGLLDIKFEHNSTDYAAFLIENWKRFKYLSQYTDPEYQVRENKLYSGEIFKNIIELKDDIAKVCGLILMELLK